MPLEPSAWDPKDFSWERKHERPESFCSAFRWKDFCMESFCSQYGAHNFVRLGSSELSRSPGQGKQGCFHTFVEGPRHGYSPSRTCDRGSGYGNCHTPGSRGDCEFGRNNRDEKAWTGQGDQKSHSWEAGCVSTNASGTPLALDLYQSLVDNASAYPSNSHPELGNTLHQVHSEEGGKASGGIDLNASCQSETETPVGIMDWKSLKWSRSGSLSSRGSGFSFSSSFKCLGAVDSCEAKVVLLPKFASSLGSPSREAGACVTSFAPSEALSSRKKPRLAWGEGLAKYEKKKVEGSEANVNKEGITVSLSCLEAVQSPTSDWVDKSPRTTGVSLCASPTTPLSVACSSSPGVEDKPFDKTTESDNDVTNLCSPPPAVSENSLVRFPFHLERLHNGSMADLCSSLDEIVQLADYGSLDSTVARSFAMNKLLEWKVDALKELEMTESEIDLLENELKVLKSESGSWSPHAVASNSFSVQGNSNLSKELNAASNLISQPASMLIDSCAEMGLEKMLGCSAGLKCGNVTSKGEDADSYWTGASKSLLPLSSSKARIPTCLEGCEGSGVMVGAKSKDSGASSDELYVSLCGNVSIPVEGQNFVLTSGDSNSRDSSDDGDSIICSKILASNKESARKALGSLSKLLPTKPCNACIPQLPSISSLWDDPLVKKQVAKRRQFLHFKERILAIKFKAFQNRWKEDVHLLSMRKPCWKPLKKMELGLHTTNGRCKRRCPSTHVLSGSLPKLYRDVLRMPTLVLDNKEKVFSRFFSSNGLVEDPFAVEKDRALINPWTAEEREIFMDQLAASGKDFRKIASFLDHKTTADCIEFYYKNHKSDCFKKFNIKNSVSKQEKQAANTYLVASRKNWNHERNAASLDFSGAVSAIAAHAHTVSDIKVASRGFSCRERNAFRMSRLDDDHSIEKLGRLNLPERETFAVDILADICSSLSSEAMGSCITNPVDPEEGCRDWKQERAHSTTKSCSLSDVTQNVSSDTYSDESCGKMDPCDWTDMERSALIQVMSSYGKDFAMMSRCVRTRSEEECRVFFSKACKSLGLDSVQMLSRKADLSMTDDLDGGGSNMENACDLEIGSVVSDGNVESKMVEDLKASPLSVNQDEPDELGSHKLKTNLSSSEKDVAAETLVFSECGAEDKPDLVSENCHNSPCINCVDSRFHLVQQSTNIPIDLTDAENKKDIETSFSLCSDAILLGGAADEFPTEKSKMDSAGQKSSLLEIDVNKIEGEKYIALPIAQTTNLARNTNHQAGDSSSLDFSESGCRHHVLIKIDSMDKSSLDTLARKASPVSYCGSLSSAACRMEQKPNQGCDQVSQSFGTLDCNEYVWLPPQGDFIDADLHGGYPLQIPAQKERNGCTDSVQNELISDAGITVPCLAQEFCLRKCVTSTHNSSILSLPDLSQNDEKPNDPRANPCNSSEIQEPTRNVDLKLFGKVLTTHRNEDNVLNEPSEGGGPCNLKLSNHMSRRNVARLKFDNDNQFGLETVPIRSYGFWDGNEAQTRLSSLPSPAILMGKYPSAFSSYPDSTVNTNGHRPKCVPVYPPRDMDTITGLAHYQICQSCDSSSFQHFTLEMQRQKAFEAACSLQQQGGGILGMNIVEPRGVVIESPCTGVFDTVSAIRMHKGKSERFNGSVTDGEDVLRGKHDLGI